MDVLNIRAEIVRQAWQALTIMRIVVNKVSRPTTRHKDLTPRIMRHNVMTVKVQMAYVMKSTYLMHSSAIEFR